MDKIFRSQFRLPVELYEQLKSLAEESGKSLNAELVYQLECSVKQPQAAKVAERRKGELVREYVRWSTKNGKDPSGGEVAAEFCKEYNQPSQILTAADLNSYKESSKNIDYISTIESIDPRYLTELYYVWCIEMPRKLGHSNVHDLVATAAYTAKMLAPELKSMSDEISFQVVSKLLDAGLFQASKCDLDSKID